MLNDYTLNVSFLGGFLFLVPFCWYFSLCRDPAVRTLNNVKRFYLDAIPTVGFSDPILLYWSALLYYLDCIHMLKEGYEKLTCLTSYAPSSYRADDTPTFGQDQICSKSPIFGDEWCL